MKKRSSMTLFSIASAWLLLGSGLGLAGCGGGGGGDDPTQQLTQDIETEIRNCRIFSCVDQTVDCNVTPQCGECSGDIFAIECCNPYYRSCTVVNKPKDHFSKADVGPRLVVPEIPIDHVGDQKPQ
jgi:hypothetical protein